MSKLVEIINVSKIYNPGENEVRALDGVSLSIDKGEFVAIIGQSGSGKSTLMNILGCLDTPTAGIYRLHGMDVSHMSDNEQSDVRNMEIGFIFQGFNLIQSLTALENVEFIAELAENPMSSKEALAKVNMSQRENNYPGQMSGGQQQRVSIARAIVKRPKLILADEPTAALDSTTSIEVLQTIEDIVKTQGTTVMMVTHNVEIAKMADRVVKVRNGKIASIKKNMHPLHAVDLIW